MSTLSRSDKLKAIGLKGDYNDVLSDEVIDKMYETEINKKKIIKYKVLGLLYLC